MQRRLVVWKGEKPELLKQTEAAPHVTEEMETAIDAFERRAKSHMSSLGRVFSGELTGAGTSDSWVELVRSWESG